MWWRRACRRKVVNCSSLSHSEASRNISSVESLGLLFCFGVPVALFSLIPFCFGEITGPSTIIATFLSFLVALLTGFHFAELSVRLPRSNPLYEYAYATNGEIWAFAVGCSVLFDYCLMSTYVARIWSRHVDFMFLHQLNATNPVLFAGSSIYHETLDWLALVGIAVAGLLVPCSVKLTVVICSVLALVCLMTLLCSIVVSLFYIDFTNWVHQGNVTVGLPEVIRSAAVLLLALVNIEAITSVVDRLTGPANCLSCLVPMTSTAIWVVLFVTAMVVSLVTPLQSLSLGTVLPSIYDAIDVPAARYLLTVGAICGLGAELLVLQIPTFSMVKQMTADGLFCCRSPCRCSRTCSFASGFPAVAVSLVCSVLHSRVLLDYLSFSLPVRFLYVSYLMILHRFDDCGFQQVATTDNYMCVSPHRSAAESLATSGDGSSSLTSSHIGTDPECRCHLSLPSDARGVVSYAVYDRHRSSTRTDAVFNELSTSSYKPMKRSTSMFTSKDVKSCLSNGASIPTRKVLRCIRGSISAYECCTTASATGLQFPTLEEGQGDESSEDNFSLEASDCPNVTEYPTTSSSNSNINCDTVHRRARITLCFYFACCVATGLITMRVLRTAGEHLFWTAITPAVSVFFCAVFTAFYFCTLPRLERQDSTGDAPGFPHLPLINCFLLCLLIDSATVSGLAVLGVWFLAVILCYFCYGHKNSVETVSSVSQYVRVPSEWKSPLINDRRRRWESGTE